MKEIFEELQPKIFAKKFLETNASVNTVRNAIELGSFASRMTEMRSVFDAHEAKAIRV